VAGQARAHALIAQMQARKYDEEDRSIALADSPALASMRFASTAAVELSAQTWDQNLQAVASHWHAQALRMGSRRPPDEAMRYARKAQVLFRDTGDEKGEAQALALVAHLQMARGEFEQAAQSAEKAQRLAQKTTDAEIIRTASDAVNAVERARSAKIYGGGQSVSRADRTGRPGAAGGQAGMAAPSIEASSSPLGSSTMVSLDPSMVRNKVMDVFRNTVADMDDVHGDTSLMEAGMDSLSTIDFTNQLTRDFNLKNSTQLVFDYPTVSEIVDHIIQESKG